MFENLKINDTHRVKNCGMRLQGGDLAKWYFNATLTDNNNTLFDSGYRNLVLDENATLDGVNEGVKGIFSHTKHYNIIYISITTIRIF